MENDTKKVLFYDKRSTFGDIKAGVLLFCRNFNALFVKGLPYFALYIIFAGLFDYSVYNGLFRDNEDYLLYLALAIPALVLSILAFSFWLAFVFANLENYSLYNKVLNLPFKEMFKVVKGKIWKSVGTAVTLYIFFFIIEALFVNAMSGMYLLLIAVPVLIIFLMLIFGLWTVSFNITDMRYGNALIDSSKLSFKNFSKSIMLILIVICALIIPIALLEAPSTILYLAEDMYNQSVEMGDEVSLPGYFDLLKFVVMVIEYAVGITILINILCIYFFFYGSLMFDTDRSRSVQEETEE